MGERKVDISPEAVSVAAEMRSTGFNIPGLGNLEQYRKDTRAGYEAYVQKALDAFSGEIKELEIAGITCKQLTPRDWSADNGPCIQYAYGGAYVSGSTHEDLILTAPLAQHCSARIVMVDYRLSPEHPYPEPQQDMQQVYLSLLERYGAARLVISGESAGGNQAVGLLQHVRDSGLDMPRCAALFSWERRSTSSARSWKSSRQPPSSSICC